MSLKYFSILDQWKMMSDLNATPEKISGFVSFLLFAFTLVIKLRNVDFKSYWNTLIFVYKKGMMSDLNMSYGKTPDNVSFPLFGFTLVINLRSFDFESHWNTFFYKKWCHICICPVKQCRISFKLPSLSWT